MGHDIIRCDFCGNDVIEGSSDWECDSCGAICNKETFYHWKKKETFFSKISIQLKNVFNSLSIKKED